MNQNCKHEHTVKVGTRRYSMGLYQMRRCVDCGHQFKSELLKLDNSNQNKIIKIHITDKSSAIKYVKAFLTTYLFEQNKTTISTQSEYMEIQEEIEKKVEIKDPKNEWSLRGSIIDIAIREILEERDS